MSARSTGPGLIALLLLLVQPGLLQPQVPAPSDCHGLTAGSLLLSEEVGAVFVARYLDGGVALEVLFLARGGPTWDTEDLTFQPWRRPKLPDSTGFLTGASIGRLFMQYDPRLKVAWVDTIKVPLGERNAVLIENAHGATPVIHSVIRIDPTIPLADACHVRGRSDYESLRKAIFEKLLSVPELREFSSPDGPDDV